MTDTFTPAIMPASAVPDNNVPRGRPSKYHFHEMGVGTAYILPADHTGATLTTKGQTRVSIAAANYARKTGWRIKTSRQQDGSVRIERIK